MRLETRVGIFILGAIAVFFYLSFNIGEFRTDRHRFNKYRAYFDDTGGLETKAPVKIAGVTVGWVEAINLMERGKAEIEICLNKQNKLARNAYAMITQEGLIGNKMLEIEPGDPSTGVLAPGSTLVMPGKTPASIADLLDQFRDIASHIQDIVFSLKSTVGSSKGEQQIRETLNSVTVASNNIAHFSEVLERTMARNEGNINDILEDMRSAVKHIDVAVPSIKDDIHGVSNQLQTDTLPAISTNVNLVGEKAGKAFDSVGGAAGSLTGTFKDAGQVMSKINTGKGVLGKLINEDEMYGDIKKTVKGLKSMVGKASTLGILVDMHSESNIKDWTSKGYFEVRIRPEFDYFYSIQLMSDETGGFERRTLQRAYKDQNGVLLDYPGTLGSTPFGPGELYQYAPTIEETVQNKNKIKFGFQFGKLFDRVALRVGLFESTFGAGVDFYVPLATDKFHWITTLEAFDFSGFNRPDDRRMHIKWSNRFYFMKHMYTTIGIDDAYSKRSSSIFWGGGIRFNDDDIKYLLSFAPRPSN